MINNLNNIQAIKYQQRVAASGIGAMPDIVQ